MTFVLLSNASQTPHHGPTAETDGSENQPLASLPTETAASEENEAKPSETRSSVLPPADQHISRSFLVSLATDSLPEEPVNKKYTVQPADTLSGILDLHNIHSSLSGLLALKEKIAPLLSLQPGDLMKLGIREGRLVSLIHETPSMERLEVVLKDDRYDVTRRVLETVKHEAHGFGAVTSSFYEAGIHAGLSDKIIIDMANILGWDIDFGLDVRKGDYFSVIYEEEYLDGEKLRDGVVQAVEFINNGKAHRAVLHTDAEGNKSYFSPNGKSMRKPFLRNPIEYTRISSHFSPRRLHPILKTVRPHRGIDYAAPHGTPIRSTGDGRVIFSGVKHGYGNVVIISHGNMYSTLYAHLSKFASGASNGKRVRQGQIIGNVGATGHATGPHLHYEFRIGGIHKNPLTVKLPDSAPLPGKEMARFNRSSFVVLKKLDTLKAAYLPANPSF